MMDKAEKVNVFVHNYLDQIVTDLNNPKIVVAKHNF